jgi:pseudouridylate synthase
MPAALCRQPSPQPSPENWPSSDAGNGRPQRCGRPLCFSPVSLQGKQDAVSVCNRRRVKTLTASWHAQCMLRPVVSPEVADALAEGRPVVAFESTIFSHLGLPTPMNAEALSRCVAAVRDQGVVPAITAVLDGAGRVGLDASEHERILGAARKVAERDVPVAIAQRWEFGATTVSASVALAHAAGVSVFATGGIGGVHRGAELTGDISADLDAIAKHPVITVSAGAKAFLDLARTMEYLETAGVPVLGWRHDWFPAFYTRSSGLPIPHRVESAAEIAAVLANRLRPETGVFVGVPIPESAELPSAELDSVLSTALAVCAAAGIVGAAVTPFVLGRIGAATEGRSVPANLALAENNARVAGEIAIAVAAG